MCGLCVIEIKEEKANLVQTGTDSYFGLCNFQFWTDVSIFCPSDYMKLDVGFDFRHLKWDRGTYRKIKSSNWWDIREMRSLLSGSDSFPWWQCEVSLKFNLSATNRDIIRFGKWPIICLDSDAEDTLTTFPMYFWMSVHHRERHSINYRNFCVTCSNCLPVAFVTWMHSGDPPDQTPSPRPDTPHRKELRKESPFRKELRKETPCGQNKWHTLVKTVSSIILCMQSVKIISRI